MGREFLRYFCTLNVFKTRSVDDEDEVRNQLICTRLYLCTFYVLLIMLMISNVLQQKIETRTIENPSMDIYEQLQMKYPASLHCPCSKNSIVYKNFLRLNARYHSICFSDFITEKWISYIQSSSDENQMTFIDFRISGPLQFRLLNRLCSLAIMTIDNALEIFYNNQLTMNTIDTEDQFHARMQQIIEEFISSITKQFALSLDLVRSTTHGNQLLSGLFTNYYLSAQFESNRSNIIKLESTGYRRQDSITEEIACYCIIDASCYQDSWIYDRGYFYPLTRIEGMVTGCYIFDSLLQSNLQCFYNRTCLNSLRTHLSQRTSNDSFDILDRSLTQRANDTIERILNRLMIEQWYQNISFEQYYHSCRPSFCRYSFTTSQSIFFLFTTFIGLCSGLAQILRSFIPRLIRLVRRKRQDSAVKNRCCQRFLEQFGRFPVRADDNDFERKTKRMLTINYLVFLSLFSTIVILYFSLIVHLTIGTLKSPTLKEYNNTLVQHPTMICSCSNLAIPHKHFLSFQPRLHQLCSSDLIGPAWINMLITLSQSTHQGNFPQIAFAQFRTLYALCELSNDTIFQSLEIFDGEYLVTASLLSKNIFEKQAQTLIDFFTSSLSKNFIQALNLLDTTTKGNDLFSALMTNYKITVDEDRQVYSIPVRYRLPKNNDSFCDCSEKTASCIQETHIGSSPIDGFYIGCYLIDALRQSTLECFYNQSCLSRIPHSLAILPLNSTLTSRYRPNTTIDDLLKNLMIEQWNETISYQNYFNACNVSNCTYVHFVRNNAVVTISNVIGMLGGFDSVFGLLIPLILKYLRRKCASSNGNAARRLTERIHSSFTSFKNSAQSFTIFPHSRSADPHSIRVCIIATRFYYLVLILLMLGYSSYTLTRTVESSETIKRPTTEQFEVLYQNYSDTLICQCNDISIKYADILSIKPIYHPICSSPFLITEEWLTDLKNLSQTLSYQLQLLQSFCQIAHETIELAMNDFLQKMFISGTVIPQKIFQSQVQTSLIDLFTSSTKQSFKRSLDLIRITTFSNQIFSKQMTNWKFSFFYSSHYNIWLTRNAPRTFEYQNNTCDCFQSNECKEQYRFLHSTSNETFDLQGFFFGCSILESLFQSTLECFYHSSCINLLTTISPLTIEPTSIVNETIERIVERLMIDRWQSNIQYQNYYQKCHPTRCTYRRNEKHTLIYLISIIIVIYSGLSYLLKLIIQIVIKCIRHLHRT